MWTDTYLKEDAGAFFHCLKKVPSPCLFFMHLSFQDAAKYRDELTVLAPHSLLKCSSDATTLVIFSAPPFHFGEYFGSTSVFHGKILIGVLSFSM